MRNTDLHKKERSNILPTFFLLAACIYTMSMQAQSGYDKASYTGEQAGKFMKAWLVAGPFVIHDGKIAPDAAVQEKTFKTDIITTVKLTAGKPLAAVTVAQTNFPWRHLSSMEDIVDLDSFYHKKDFAYAYALAEIKVSAPTNMLLAVGSDDAIKIWHNGKLVHENWMPRGTVKDNDLVPLKLVKGTNQLLLKVQDMEGGWSFVARLLDKAGLTDKLNIAAANGNLDQIKILLEGGADVNAGTTTGITPLMTAKLSGREDVVKMLLAKGATDKAFPPAETLIDNFYTSLKGKERPGIAILVARDGKVLYRKGFGYADINNKALASPDTKFRIGSVTKQFTAAAILKLQENNLLSVKDKLSKFIPDFPRGDEVTIDQLLTHTSGIHSYTSKDDFTDKVTKSVSPDSLINAIKKDPFDFNPGERMLYNNSGYFILGYIIGKVSGKPYGQYLKETFFDPLQMSNTGVHYAGIKLEHEARGYGKKASGLYEEALNWDMSWAGGAGALYSTVDDLLKWNQALYGGKVLTEKSLAEALTPAVLKNNASPSMQYGYGLGLSKYRGEDIVSHGGGLHGFITQLAYYPKEKLSLVMFSNTDEPEVNFDPNKIAEAYLWDKMEKQISYAETAEKPKDLQVFTGRFDLLGVGVLTITTESDKLFAQVTGQPKFEIFAMSANEFFWKVVDARIKFFQNDKGEMSQAIVYQNGQELKATKIAEEVIVTVDTAVLDSYTGKYRLNESTVVVVSREKTRLFAEPTGQPKFEMLAVSDSDFVIKEINAKVSFEKDASGKAIKIKLNMSNSNTDLPRIE